MSTVLADWDQGEFSAEGFTRTVYRRGRGPGVIVIHEVPGITPAVTAFANDVVACGFTVLMPSLLGTPGRGMSLPYAMSSMARLCVSKEFATWATRRTSPIIAWLRALAKQLHQEVGGPGVGAVGMCFSGGFALAMMVDDTMVAPVLSQPSLPLAFFGKEQGADLGISDEDAQVVQQRAAAGCQVLGLRYTGDAFIGTRFESLRRLLGDAFLAVELPSQSAFDHSVLTEHRDEPSVQRVLQFFRQKLQPSQQS